MSLSYLKKCAVWRRLLHRNPGFFDAAYYARGQSGLHRLAAKVMPLTHYSLFGADNAPNGVFDPAYYRAHAGGENPALHYLIQGWQAGLKPHPLFDPGFYLAQYPDVAASGEEPLSHYLRAGWKLGYDPHPFFDVTHYLFAYDDLARAGIEPLQHYIANGAVEARRPHALFKPDHYVQTQAGVSLQEALAHYHDNADAKTRALFTHAKLRARGRVKRIDDYAAAAGQPIIDLPENRVHRWLSPHVINRSRSRAPIETTLPRTYVAVLSNVTAFPGTRLLLTTDGQILHDELAGPRASQYHDKLKAIGSCTDGICTISASYIGIKLKSALLVSSDTDFNYFHMLIETLPKLRLAEAAGCPLEIPILMQGDLHPNLVTALERAAGERKIVYAPWGSAIEVDELWYVSDRSRVMSTNRDHVDDAYDIAISPSAVRDVSQLLLGGRKLPPGQKRIYLSRNSHYRHLSNQDAFMAMLSEKGFHIVDTAQLTLDEQMAAVRDAGTIIAPTGAALTNLLWCPQNTKVLILVVDHPQMNLNIYNQVGEPLGAVVEFCLGDRLYQMHGDHSIHDNFEVDVNVISEWCDRQDAKAA